MHEEDSSYSDRYDILKKLCRQQLLLNESLKLELSKVSQLLQKVSHERDILISELLENHSNCVVQSHENQKLVPLEQGQQLSQVGVHKRSYSSPGGTHHVPVKSRKETVADNAGCTGNHPQDQAEFESRASIDTDFEDLELPVTSRVKSPLRSPHPPHFEATQTQVPRACHPSDRTQYLQTSSPSAYVNSAGASDGAWMPTPAGSDSPPAVTTLTRATKPTTLLTNSLVVSSTPVLSQRPTLVTSQPTGAVRLQSTAVGMAPPVKLTFSGPRPRLVTNVPILGKPGPAVQHRPSLFTASLIPGQQRIVIQTSAGGSTVAQNYPRASVPSQNPIRNSP